MKHILIVEDDESFGEVLRELILAETRGASRVDLATTAADGMSHVESRPVSVLLLDLSLPDSHPTETTRKFATAFPELPIVVLTSQADDSTGVTATKDGAQDFLDKTAISPGVLARSLRHAIERKRMARMLEERNAELKRFAHTLAHEVKTPLQAIQFSIRLIEEWLDEGVSQEFREVLEQSLSTVDSLSTLVGDLLKFAEAQPDVSALKPVDLADCARRAWQALVHDDGYESATITIGELPPALGSPVHLRQVFRNLFSNALRYRGDHPARIEVGSAADRVPPETLVAMSEAMGGSPDAKHHVYYVTDQGIGIAPEHHGKIFDSFYRIDADTAPEGSGIGLGFCRSVLKSHHGGIWVESEPGQGATFLFFLPEP